MVVGSSPTVGVFVDTKITGRRGEVYGVNRGVGVVYGVSVGVNQ